MVYHKMVKDTKSSIGRVQKNMNLKERALEEIEFPAEICRRFRHHSDVDGRDGGNCLYASQRNRRRHAHR